MNDIDGGIRNALISVGADPSAICETSTVRTLCIHSLDAFNVIMALEEKFDIQLSDRNIDLEIDTVATMLVAVHAAILRRRSAVLVAASFNDAQTTTQRRDSA